MTATNDSYTEDVSCSYTNQLVFERLCTVDLLEFCVFLECLQFSIGSQVLVHETDSSQHESLFVSWICMFAIGKKKNVIAYGFVNEISLSEKRKTLFILEKNKTKKQIIAFFSKVRTQTE